jgi:hypothetical protein
VINRVGAGAKPVGVQRNRLSFGSRSISENKPSQHGTRGRNVGLPKLNPWKFDMKTSFTQAKELARALARYIAERPRQADSLIHWPSFAHCFEAFALASEQDVHDVLLAFEQAGWLTVDSAGHRITQQATRLAQSGQVPPLQGN